MTKYRNQLVFMLLLPLVVLIASACSTEKDKDPGDGVRVKIPFLQSGSYVLKVVELLTLTDIQTLKGSAAQFLMEPGAEKSGLRGRAPHLRYIFSKDNVVIAKDDISLQLLTLYYHLENLQKLDQSMGLEKAVKWPRKVAIDIQYRGTDGVQNNNAFYSGQYDALLFAPFKRTDLPLAVNAGVIGHEHFHALYQKLLIEPLGDKYPKLKANSHAPKGLFQSMGLENEEDEKIDIKNADLRNEYHTVLLRAVNEGFADVWGWVYSGDSTFVGRSLPQKRFERDLDHQILGVSSQAHWAGAVEEILMGIAVDPKYIQASLEQISYYMGTEIARTVKNSVNVIMTKENITEADARKKVGAQLIQTVVALKKSIEELKEDEWLSSSQVLKLYLDQSISKSQAECDYFQKLAPKQDGVICQTPEKP